MVGRGYAFPMTEPGEDPKKREPSGKERLGDYKRPTMYFEKEPSLGRGAGAWMGVGFEFAVYVVLFFLGGKWLDGNFGWEPWGAAVGALLGVFVGM